MIELHKITKYYCNNQQDTSQTLKDISITISSGTFCAITGPSGSGKSTLLNIIGLLDRQTSGSLTLANKQIINLSAKQAARLRNQFIGFIFQSFQLLPRLTAWENIALPLIYRKMPYETRRCLAINMLKQVGLENFATYHPSQLSGGQQQRVAIARALIGTPKLLLADEPTGSLDSKTSTDIFSLLQRLNSQLGITIIMVTHDEALATRCDRQIKLFDGSVVNDSETAPA